MGGGGRWRDLAGNISGYPWRIHAYAPGIRPSIAGAQDVVRRGYNLSPAHTLSIRQGVIITLEGVAQPTLSPTHMRSVRRW
jgi:hypothetical protein